MEYTYETLVLDTKTRDDFFKQYDRLIEGLKKYKFWESALRHKKNRDRIFNEVTMLD